MQQKRDVFDAIPSPEIYTPKYDAKMSLFQYLPSGGESHGGVLRLVHVHLHPEVNSAAVFLLHPQQPKFAAEQLAAVGYSERAVKLRNEVGTAEGEHEGIGINLTVNG